MSQQKDSSRAIFTHADPKGPEMESCKSQNNTLQHKLVSTTQIDFDKLSGLIFQCYGYQSKHHDLLHDQLDEKNDYFYVTTVHCESAHGNASVRDTQTMIDQSETDIKATITTCCKLSLTKRILILILQPFIASPHTGMV